LQTSQIAFLLRRGKKLIEAYLKLLSACEQDRNYAYHLDELMRLGAVGGEKGTAGGTHHG
jgi:hypothetical protein